ncbi:MAG: hypothetical protein HC923_02955 [Myxococcales bacterium]|nr:hypothetical protein [Myxococcales bacterium]
MPFGGIAEDGYYEVVQARDNTWRLMTAPANGTRRPTVKTVLNPTGNVVNLRSTDLQKEVYVFLLDASTRLAINIVDGVQGSAEWLPGDWVRLNVAGNVPSDVRIFTPFGEPVFYSHTPLGSRDTFLGTLASGAFLNNISSVFFKVFRYTLTFLALPRSASGLRQYLVSG